MSISRTPPEETSALNHKRKVEQISPDTPNSKKSTNNAGKVRVADMTLDQLLSVLASKDDFHQMKDEIVLLKEENKSLVEKVGALTQKCHQLESDMQSLYIWKNSSNLVVKLNREGADTEEAKARVACVCSELANVRDVVGIEAIRELKTKDRKKHTFKVSFKEVAEATAVLKNTNKLRGTDVSIAKDLPQTARMQNGKLLAIRRFLLKKSTCKPRLQGQALIVGADKITWNLAEGKALVNNGEPFDSVLAKYQLTRKDYADFLLQHPRGDNLVIREPGLMYNQTA